MEDTATTAAHSPRFVELAVDVLLYKFYFGADIKSCHVTVTSLAYETQIFCTLLILSKMKNEIDIMLT